MDNIESWRKKKVSARVNDCSVVMSSGPQLLTIRILWEDTSNNSTHADDGQGSDATIVAVVVADTNSSALLKVKPVNKCGGDVENLLPQLWTDPAPARAKIYLLKFENRNRKSLFVWTIEVVLESVLVNMKKSYLQIQGRSLFRSSACPIFYGPAIDICLNLVSRKEKVRQIFCLLSCFCSFRLSS